MSDAISWTPELKARLRELYLGGANRQGIADTLTREQGREVSYTAVDSIIRRMGIAGKALTENPNIELFNKHLHLPMDDYIVTLDYHSPYYSVLWHNRCLAIKDKLKIGKIIVVGDLLDFGFASHYYADHPPKIDDEADENCRLIQSLAENFDEIILLKGNHEDRLGRITNGIIQAEYLLALWGRAAWDEGRIKYSLYDKLTIGDDWLLVHPKSYSRVSGSVGKQLAAKFHKNIINAHGHFISYGYDISGDYVAVDLGGMFDIQKIGYINKKTSTHPQWNQGCGALLNGHFYLFDNKTDWDFWFGKIQI